MTPKYCEYLTEELKKINVEWVNNLLKFQKKNLLIQFNNLLINNYVFI